MHMIVFNRLGPKMSTPILKDSNCSLSNFVGRCYS